MKNSELFDLLAGIQSAGQLTGVKLAYALAINLKKISAEIEALQSGIKPSEEFETYDKARIELCKLHAKKDDKDEPILVDNSYMIGDQAAFDGDMEKLQEEHADALESDKTAKEEYTELLEEEANVSLHKVSLDEFPEAVTAAQMSQLMEMVKDEE